MGCLLTIHWLSLAEYALHDVCRSIPAARAGWPLSIEYSPNKMTFAGARASYTGFCIGTGWIFSVITLGLMFFSPVTFLSSGCRCVLASCVSPAYREVPHGEKGDRRLQDELLLKPEDYLVLRNWLEGEADEDSLRDWLKRLYPPSIHGAIDEAFDPGDGEREL